MKKVFATAIVALLLTGIMYFLPVGSNTAHAATSTSHAAAKSSIVTGPCTNRAFLKITSLDNGDTCFANTGYIGFRITNAQTLHAGSNSGWVQCYATSGSCSKHHRFYFYSYSEYNMGGALITQVDITATS